MSDSVVPSEASGPTDWTAADAVTLRDLLGGAETEPVPELPDEVYQLEADQQVMEHGGGYRGRHRRRR